MNKAMNLIHFLGFQYAFLSGKGRELGLTHSLSSLLLFGVSDILVIIMMTLGYHLKMVGGFQKMFTSGSVKVYMNLSYHLCCVKMFEIQMLWIMKSKSYPVAIFLPPLLFYLALSSWQLFLIIFTISDLSSSFLSNLII